MKKKNGVQAKHAYNARKVETPTRIVLVRPSPVNNCLSCCCTPDPVIWSYPPESPLPPQLDGKLSIQAWHALLVDVDKYGNPGPICLWGQTRSNLNRVIEKHNAIINVEIPGSRFYVDFGTVVTRVDGIGDNRTTYIGK